MCNKMLVAHILFDRNAVACLTVFWLVLTAVRSSLVWPAFACPHYNPLYSQQVALIYTQ